MLGGWGVTPLPGWNESQIGWVREIGRCEGRFDWCGEGVARPLWEGEREVRGDKGGEARRGRWFPGFLDILCATHLLRGPVCCLL